MVSGIMQSLLRELVLPPFSLFFLLLVGILLRGRHPRFGRVLRRSALFLLFFLCTGLGTRMLVYPLENLATPLRDSHTTGAQAIVVLAAGRYSNAPEYGGREIPDYIALARLRYAAKLHREIMLPILVSGGNGTADGRYEPKAVAMTRALQDEFATPVKWAEPDSENTQQNAVFSARMLKQAGITRILLVTDAMHMRRAATVFKQAGLDVVEAPTIFFSSNELTWLSLLPDAENLRRSYYASYEWIGLFWYWIRYAP
jgi:uncharacterized SAM-binding protein YcdF (DUF218 family)